MLRLSLVLSLLAMLCPAETDLEQAERLYETRHLDPAYLDSSLFLLTTVRQAEPGNEGCLALLAQAFLSQGDCAQGQNRKLRCYQQALAWADTLRRLNDNNAQGHLWWAAARGLVGQQKGILNSLWMLPQVKRELERALELDPQDESPYVGLGVLNREVPAIAGGDLARAHDYFTRGLEVRPDSPELYLEFARLKLRLGQRDSARSLLEKALDIAEPSDPAAFALDLKPAIARLLADLQ
jgi:tetratricopeptide (TPR) repeat protein